uniref:DB domain-containing protein n=1 Tax=Panagrellus redivivus TaxID=6233 RepID=A0A7E4WB76_PANRE
MVVGLVLAVLLPLANAQYYVYQQQQQYYPQQQYYQPQQQPQVQYYQQQQQQYYAQQQPQPQVQAQAQPQQPQVDQQWYQQQQPQAQLPAPTYHEAQAPAPATYQEVASPSAPAYQEVAQVQDPYAPKIPHPDQAFDIPPPSTPSTRFIAASETKILTPGRRTLVNRPAQPRPIHTPSPVTNRRPISRGRTVSSVPRAPPPPAPTPAPVVVPKPAPAPVVTPKPRRPATPTSHLSPSKDPNSYFLSCCKNKKVDKKCESRCNFDNLSKKVLTGMFLGSDPCPQADGLDLFSCAAQDGDHTPCCRRKNVMRTGAGDKCLNFCKMTPDAQFQADASYLPCWAVLNDIKACFKESIIDVIARQA